MSKGVIYVLTNPSFPEYVKIGYADDLDKRLVQLNRSECLPFAFRVYCTYEVEDRLKDKDVHNLIDRLNPDLRAIETFEGKARVREFYNISAVDAYEILYSIASISGTISKLKKCNLSENEERDELIAMQNEEAISGVYTEQGHLEQTTVESKILYEKFKLRVLEFGNVSIEPRKLYIAFKVNSSNFCSVVIQRSKLKIIINMVSGSLEDPHCLARDISKVGHWSTGDYSVDLTNNDMIDYVIELVKQSFNAQIGFM